MNRPLLDLKTPPLLTCASTQALCIARARAGAPEGTCVRALEQTEGRGRGEHRWHSAPGLGLYLSFLLRPKVSRSLWPGLTPLVALALAETLDSYATPCAVPDAASGAGCGTGSDAGSEDGGSAAPRLMIKWPNDVFGRRGKVAGILADVVGEAGTAFPPEQSAGVVVGVGINLAHREADFPPEIRGKASSLFLEGIDPLPAFDGLAIRLNERLTFRYRQFQNALRDVDLEFLRRELLSRFFLQGARVRIRTGLDPAGARHPIEETTLDQAGGRSTDRIEGTARDLGPLGELILATSEGDRVIVSGEVESWSRPSGESR